MRQRNTKGIDHKLQVFINTCLRQILRIRRPDTFPTGNFGRERDRNQSQSTWRIENGDELDTPCVEGRTASPAMPWTGTRKASARGVDQSRPGAERWTQSWKPSACPGERRRRQPKIETGGSLQWWPYVPVGTKMIKSVNFFTLANYFGAQLIYVHILEHSWYMSGHITSVL